MNALEERAASIIKPLIPPDAEERVKRAFNQWNQIIREHIRNETGLKLSDGGGKYSIPIRVVTGFPDKLAKLIDDYDDRVLWLLILGQPKLGGVIEGLTFLLSHWDQLEQWGKLPDQARNGKANLQTSQQIVNALQQAALAEKVREQIKAINEDILGAYFYPEGKGYWIELYWMPIAMLAAMLDVRIEDLTLVVLAHELAHGYTHLGRDIEGGFWRDTAFQQTDLNIKEGLAQFYTQVVTTKIAERIPGPKQAYEKLLALQNGPYIVHQNWLGGRSRRIGEAIRFALIAVRNREVVNYDLWLKMLDDADVTLRSNKWEDDEY
ncbi:MAG: hypothetical protein ACREEM_03640 [Blastocatellia bacterium]